MGRSHELAAEAAEMRRKAIDYAMLAEQAQNDSEYWASEARDTFARSRRYEQRAARLRRLADEALARELRESVEVTR